MAGVVEHDANGFEAGQRVVAMVGTGGYAEYAAGARRDHLRDPRRGVRRDRARAARSRASRRGTCTATSAQLRAGESVVVHAAAGGVGSLAVQLGAPLGAGRVIATASTEAKRALALELGADAAVDVTREDLTERADGGQPRRARRRRARDGRRPRVRRRACKALAPFGRLVTYGMASREPNEVATGALMRPSRAVVGFWLMHCLLKPAELVDAPLRDLFELRRAGELRVVEGETYGLSEARRAHEDLQARRTIGKLLLDPSR